MKHTDNALLQAIPDPALITRQGRVVCFNAAAGELFPQLACGGPAPDPLPSVPDSGGLILVGDRSWHITAAPMDDALLLLLHPARLEGLSTAQLDGVVRILREQTSQLLLSVQLLSAAEDPSLEERLCVMNRTLCLMLRQINHIDLLRELDAGIPSFCPTVLDLAGLCREVTLAAAPLLAQAEVALVFDSPLTSLLVSGDSELLQNLLLELISNAARTASRGGQVTVSLSRREGRALLTFTNDSRRPDPRPLPQLLSGVVSPARIPAPGEGAGLGLMLAQRVMALHKGALLMERQDDDRVCVTAALPLSGQKAPLPVRTPAAGFGSGLPRELVALAEVLPACAYSPRDLE